MIVRPDVGELETLVRELSTLVAGRLESWYRPGVTFAAPPTAQVRPWSVFVRFPITAAGSGGPAALLVKMRRHPDFDVRQMVTAEGLRAQGGDEFETLRRLERLTADSSAHCAIRAVDYFAEWNALVMEELPARTAKRAVTRGGVAPSREARRRLEVVFERAGSLLRTFHEEVDSPHDGPIVDDEERDALAATLGYVERRSGDVMQVDEIHQLVARVEELGSGAAVPHARLHRDLNCANLLVDHDDRVGLLDPRMLPGAVYRDIAKLLVDLETFSIQGLTHGLFLRDSAQAFGRAVLRGYFDGSEPNRVALEFFRLAALIEKWRYDDEGTAQIMRRRAVAVAKGVVAWRQRFLVKLVERQRERLQAALERSGA